MLEMHKNNMEMEVFVKIPVIGTVAYNLIKRN